MQDVANQERAVDLDHDRRQGVVRWFSPERGFGIIAADDGGPDLFVRHEDIAMDGFRSLGPGQCVEFQPAEDEHGPVAVDVRTC